MLALAALLHLDYKRVGRSRRREQVESCAIVHVREEKDIGQCTRIDREKGIRANSLVFKRRGVRSGLV